MGPYPKQNYQEGGYDMYYNSMPLPPKTGGNNVNISININANFAP